MHNRHNLVTSSYGIRFLGIAALAFTCSFMELTAQAQETGKAVVSIKKQ
jgi:hypothetical protein